MNLLAIDTSTDMCSVALNVGGEVTRKEELVPQQHASRLLPMIEELLSESQLTATQLDGLVFGQGPGSFTGVRIAAAAAQGIALASDIDVLGVSTLQALAVQAHRELSLIETVALIDARMGQVYWACFQVDAEVQYKLIGEECVSDPVDVRPPESQKWTGVGSGAMAYSDKLVAENLIIDLPTAQMYPLAADMLRLALPRFRAGEAVSVELGVPVYIRDKVALTEKERVDLKASS